MVKTTISISNSAPNSWLCSWWIHSLGLQYSVCRGQDVTQYPVSGMDLGQESKSISAVMLLWKDSDLFPNPPWMERQWWICQEACRHSWSEWFLCISNKSLIWVSKSAKTECRENISRRNLYVQVSDVISLKRDLSTQDDLLTRWFFWPRFFTLIVPFASCLNADSVFIQICQKINLKTIFPTF